MAVASARAAHSAQLVSQEALPDLVHALAEPQKPAYHFLVQAAATQTQSSGPAAIHCWQAAPYHFALLAQAATRLQIYRQPHRLHFYVAYYAGVS
jgi:hypothetical protein